jgi:hypothetical protein
VPVNAAHPERYGGSPAASPTPTRSYGSPASSPSASRGYGGGGGGAGVPVNAAQPARYGSGGSVPVNAAQPARYGSGSSVASAPRYGGGSGMAGDYGAAPVQHKKTWEQVRCPGCGATLAGRSTVTIVAKEWYGRRPSPHMCALARCSN